ncbi:DMT family transporter [Vibrio genomosp. F10]|uniref:DMT family transporter n=1 Tax=Vibrio genomosp. F10 TaxID=723171 RepID=UPI0003650FB0|nr:DMT family transporter [Vibrio genomosp. F10]OEF05218.1 multidrug transporter [Vibrio genomosp. F10 str. 9ZB36]
MLKLSAVSLGIVLLVIGNLAASLSDVAVKLLDGGISPFQYIFLRQLFSIVLLVPFWLRLPKQQKALDNPVITLARATLVLIGSGCMMVAITHLPLATANAIFYAAPLLMLPLSSWLLEEKPNMSKVFATMIGFAGVLIVLRPSQFHWAAIFALGTALTLALFNILVRLIPKEQPVITTLVWTTLFSLPTSGLLAWVFWEPIEIVQLGWVALSASLILVYNAFAVMAYKKTHAYQIAIAEYTGLLFVTLFGIWWFAEIPDLLTLLGIALIVLPILPVKKLLKASSLLASAKTSVGESEKHH